MLYMDMPTAENCPLYSLALDVACENHENVRLGTMARSLRALMKRRVRVEFT
jgi:hypothetical protein